MAGFAVIPEKPSEPRCRTLASVSFAAVSLLR